MSENLKLLKISVCSLPIFSIFVNMSEKATCQRFQYKGCNFLSPIYTIEHLEKLEHFEVRDSDVFAVTYPKSGTMWMQQILSLIYSDDDTPAVQSKSAMERVPWIELPNSNFEVRQSPRLSVTHLPYHLVPKGLKDKQGKVIYVARNPRDVLMSLYYLHNHLSTFETPKSFQDFMEQFVDGRVEFSSWFDHIKDWYDHRHEFNFLYMTYEDMKKDLRGAIQKVCNFLEKHLDDKKLDTIVKQCTFSTMKATQVVNYEKTPDKSPENAFLRKGTFADLEKHFAEPQIEMFNRIFQEKLKDSPLRFSWDNTENMDEQSSELIDSKSFTYKGCIFSVAHVLERLEQMENYDVRDSDVYVVTYPKSGTVWMQHIMKEIFTDVDLDDSENKASYLQVPWLELKIDSINTDDRPSPRLFVTHLNYDLIPRALKKKKGKVIYIYRNPKDVAVSYYHFRIFAKYMKTPKNFETFLQEFLDGQVDYNGWFDHVKNWYDHRDEFNIVFQSYEEMSKDLRTAVQNMSKFLGKSLDDNRIDQIVKSSTFKNMKANPKSNYEDITSESFDKTVPGFMRKGIIGDWKNYFTVAQSELVDKIFQEKMKGFPLKIIWEQ
ncbi:uncharacterized protein LOC103182604 [Callorhinchus milii]|uniref:uncharacterized protein LOC103182604 n=1 Tax=Callorhinchus milii TaxID=7868 RepID=UPI001C3FCE13|nr:uncharacterized protein LOC103182604 [Callorhinchus milii]